MTWDDVDFQHETIIIQSKRGNEQGIVDWNPKDVEKREIKAHSSLFNILKKLKTKKTDNNPYVFSLNEKGRVNEDWISRLFIRIVKKAEIKNKVSLHSLRHSYAVWNLKTGNVRALEALRQLLGHASYKTVQIYTRFLPKDIQNYETPPKFW